MSLNTTDFLLSLGYWFGFAGIIEMLVISIYLFTEQFTINGPGKQENGSLSARNVE